jgi:hypothetical protein
MPFTVREPHHERHSLIANSSTYPVALSPSTLLRTGLSKGAERIATQSPTGGKIQPPPVVDRKINFVFAPNRRTTNPEGWEEYDGSIYNPTRGYGWLTDLTRHGEDRGGEAAITLPDGTNSSPKNLDRLELANWQGTHQENLPLVFRIDLADGWYRITCSSVDPDTRPLPLVDQRNFKCRAHDVIFAGGNYGRPVVIRGNELVRDTGIVEVTDGHLRIVVGDPAYGGWTWVHPGPWYKGWILWWGSYHQYATTWSQKFSRTVDSGFHSLRLNSLEIERIPPPRSQTSLVFRDFFNRDDSNDINAGVMLARRWVKFKWHPNVADSIRAELYKTSIKLEAPQSGPGVLGLIQRQLSPSDGIIRYSTRVSLFTGAGSQLHSGAQEAGIIILAEPLKTNEFNSTFVGIAFDGNRKETRGRLIYRVGDGAGGYRTDLEVSDTSLPFKITEGEFEIVVDHDVTANLLTRITVNGVDVTNRWSSKDRRQRIAQGLFGIRGAINKTGLRQFFWYYRVEEL